jgi:predicted Zn-dependent protease
VGPHHVGHLIGWLLGSAVTPVVLGSLLGRRGAWTGVLCASIATAWLLLWLPRAAHAAFEAARFARAGRYYRLIGSFAFTRKRERAAVLSRAACSIAAGDLTAASATLDAIDPAALDASERVVWLNNRACVALEDGGDAHGALALADEATALRPDVPAIQHTRAKALLAVGRVDDAITVLDAMRSGGELSPYLEAERCRELALAWDQKGQSDYAADYRARARLHAPAR